MQDTREICKYMLHKLEQAEIITEPFPHIIVDQLFPESFFESLVKNFPDRSHFRKVFYPGTGYGKRDSRYQDYGLACADLSKHAYFRDVHDLFKSEPFSRLLLTKFSQSLQNGSTPIPSEKHHFFRDGASNYTPVFDLQIDFPGYELPPHPDVPEKIVTFQFFLTADDMLRKYGTLLCKPKNGKATVDRSRIASMTGLFLDKSARVLLLHRSGLYRRLVQSKVGLWFGVGATRNWLPWGLFDVVKVAPALPNCFMAFAPNDRSYHAARMDVPADIQQERRVIRGFIRSGENTKNWIRAADKVG
jgi:hypothetical protein